MTSNQNGTLSGRTAWIRKPRKAVALLSTFALGLGVLAVGGGLGGCSKAKEAEPSAAPSTTKTPEPVYNPLTGQKVASEGDLPDHPAVTIKIPADRRARPQAGLEQADNVWVQLVEGGEIRYNAVFYTNTPDNVGPVRSVRPMDGEINGPLAGVFLCSGGQQQFIDTVKGQVGQFYTENTAGDATWRTKDRKIPFNLYTSVEKLIAKAKVDNPGLTRPKMQWSFATSAEEASPVKAQDAQAANNITVKFPAWKSGWAWNAEAGKWGRSDKGQQTDDTNGSQIMATNIVMLQVTTVDTGAKDPVGEPVLASQMVSEGAAKVAVGGKIIDGTWKKTGVTEPVQLLDKDGNEIKLAPGNVWIEATPSTDGWVTLEG